MSVALALCACAQGGDADERVSVTRAALSVCEEEVPQERFIDGIPAYAQCAGAENGAIYSSNGVDTSTESLGPEWIRTQWSGGYQCTELAHRYLYFVWGIDWVPRGNAGTWCDSPPPDDIGIVQTQQPVHGDVMVLPPGSCGASPSTGHVAMVDVVQPDGRLSVVEQNRANRGRYDLSCAACFLHVEANDGSGVPGGVAGAGGGAAGTSGAGGAAGIGAAGAAAEPVPPPAMPAPMPAAPVPVSTPAAGSAAPMPAPAPAPAPLAAPIPPPAPVIPIQPRPQQEPEAATCAASAGHTGSTSPAALLLAAALLALRRRPRKPARG